MTGQLLIEHDQPGTPNILPFLSIGDGDYKKRRRRTMNEKLQMNCTLCEMVVKSSINHEDAEFVEQPDWNHCISIGSGSSAFLLLSEVQPTHVRGMRSG